MTCADARQLLERLSTDVLVRLALAVPLERLREILVGSWSSFGA